MAVSSVDVKVDHVAEHYLETGKIASNALRVV